MTRPKEWRAAGALAAGLPRRGVARQRAGLAFRLVVAGALLALTAGTPRGAEPQGAPRAGPGFTDVTAASGVGPMLEEKYRNDPKWWLSGLNLIDLDGDGRLDLFLAAHSAGGALAALNDGHGRFTPAPGFYPPTEVHLPYDLDEDGKVDLQMTAGDGGGQWWLNESVPGRLAFREIGAVAGQARQNAMVDLNRDGRVDWLHEGRGAVVFEFGDGRGRFTPSGGLEVRKTRFEINIHPADLDGDGFLDLAVQWGRYEDTQGRSRIYRNDGRLNFRNVTAEAGLAEEGVAIKGVADVNQDGHPDLLVLDHLAPRIYLNDGRGKFVAKDGAITGLEAARKPHYASWGLATVTDFDNDGVADILWNGRYFLWLLRGTGQGAFTYMNAAWGVEDQSAASVDDGLCFGDIDGDGRLDIVGYTGSLDSRRGVKVYRNALAGGNWIRVRPVGAAGHRAAAGSTIRVFEPGSPRRLLWYEQVAILGSQSAHAYYAYALTERHFGLGTRGAVDVSVEFQPSGRTVERRGVKANAVLEVPEETPDARPDTQEGQP